MQLKVKQRIGLSSFFFLSGLIFSSWTSRIPTIKSTLNLNEAELGSLLLIMPISSFVGLGASGWLLERFDTRWPLIISFIVVSFFLFMIGNSDSDFLFGISIFLFAFTNRILNISMNTQAITLQKNYGKTINGSFHALWSLGGIAGVGTTTLLVAFQVGIISHLLSVGLFVIFASLLMFRLLLKNDKEKSLQRIVWRKPDPKILNLSLMILLAATCEGGMFDWSGVYLKEVVNVEIFSMGYFIFMVFMSSSRFASDWFISHIGMQKMYYISASIVASGLLLAVLLPHFLPVMIGFSLVGIGTAAIIPMTLSLTGTSTRFSPGMAISLVSTFAMVGILTGPPVIGWIAHVTSLRVSFALMAVAAIMIIPASRRFFRINATEDLRAI
jgi:MFS family permease